jgi:hypothetical protein
MCIVYPAPILNGEEIAQLKNIMTAWQDLVPGDLRLGLRQKGVDMRIGLEEDQDAESGGDDPA